jgi:membrane fusion protein, macrolide-specific efflux system
MSFIGKLFSGINSIRTWFTNLSIFRKLLVLTLLVGVGWFIIPKLKSSKTSVQYQTDTARKDTLVIAVSASGSVSSANSASVSTQTSGVVSKIFVKNGDVVKSGDPIAEVDLDMEGKQRSAQAFASYQNAKNSLDNAHNTYYSLQSDLFTKWNTFNNLAQNGTYQNGDGSPNIQNRQSAQFISTNDDWLATEAKYKLQQNVVAAAQTSLTSSWASYQQASPTIYAPISGKISGLSLQVGSVLTSQTSSTGNSTSQRIANIKTDATPTATVNLSEMDVPKIAPGNKVTLTLDAFPSQTFTGKIVSIDTTGGVSSGVTTYPASIIFDTAVDGIYPNMAVDAKIITKVKDSVILVPNAAVHTTNTQSTVNVMKQGKVTTVTVEVGDANDTDTEIVSGIAEGDVVVTSSTATTSTTSRTATSAFSGIGGRGFGGVAGGR